MPQQTVTGSDIPVKLGLSEKKNKCLGNNCLVIVWHIVWVRDR